MHDQDIVFIVHKYISSQELQRIRTHRSLCNVCFVNCSHSCVDWKQSPSVPSGVQKEVLSSSSPAFHHLRKQPLLS